MSSGSGDEDKDSMSRLKKISVILLLVYTAAFRNVGDVAELVVTAGF